MRVFVLGSPPHFGWAGPIPLLTVGRGLLGSHLTSAFIFAYWTGVDSSRLAPAADYPLLAGDLFCLYDCPGSCLSVMFGVYWIVLWFNKPIFLGCSRNLALQKSKYSHQANLSMFPTLLTVCRNVKSWPLSLVWGLYQPQAAARTYWVWIMFISIRVLHGQDLHYLTLLCVLKLMVVFNIPICQLADSILSTK